MNKSYSIPALVLLLACAISAQAQTEKGHLMLNLQNFNPLTSPLGDDAVLAPWTAFGIGFGTQTIKDSDFGIDRESNYASMGLGLSALYFVADNFAIGGGLNFAFQRTVLKKEDNTEVENGTTGTAGQFLLGPEARYYFPLSASFKPYVRATAGLGSLNFNSGTDPVILQYGAGAGLSYFPSNRVAVNLGLNYNNAKWDFRNDTDYSTRGFGADIGFSVFFGGTKD
jgi:opacity protein-like surface antigen